MKQKLYERLKKISERLKKEYHAEKIILYGSYARGEGTEDSDIDILIIAPTTEPMFKRMATARGLIRDLRNGLPFSPVVFTSEEFISKLNQNDPFIKTVMEEGILL